MAGQKKAPKSNAQKRKSFSAASSSKARMSESEISKGSKENLSQSFESVQQLSGEQLENTNQAPKNGETRSQAANQEPLIFHSKASQEKAEIKPAAEAPVLKEKEGTKVVAHANHEPHQEPTKPEEKQVESKRAEPKPASAVPAPSKHEEPQKPAGTKQVAEKAKAPSASQAPVAPVEEPTRNTKEEPRANGENVVTAGTPIGTSAAVEAGKSASCRCIIQ